MEDIKRLCDAIREIAYAIHKYHSNGHLEKLYENVLAHRLRKAGFDVLQQYSLRISDENGTIVGDYFADLLINKILIVELKAAKTIAPEHEAQVIAYLKGTKLKHGLLINFGAAKFEIRKFAVYLLTARR